MNFSFGSVNIL